MFRQTVSDHIFHRLHFSQCFSYIRDKLCLLLLQIYFGSENASPMTFHIAIFRLQLLFCSLQIYQNSSQKRICIQNSFSVKLTVHSPFRDVFSCCLNSVRIFSHFADTENATGMLTTGFLHFTLENHVLIFP